MNVVYRSAGTIVVVGLIVAWSTMRSEQKLETMVASYELNQAQTEFAKSCISSLDYHDKEFRGGASHHAECGCMAKSLADETDASANVDYSQASAAFRSVVKFSETDDETDTDFAAMFEDMTQNQGLSYPDAISATTEIGRVMDVCKSAKMPKTRTKMNAVSVGGEPYQPASFEAPVSTKGCDGLSAASIETLQKIADWDGKTLEQMCARVVS